MENNKKTKLNVALIVCLSVSVACNILQIILRIVAMAGK